MGSSLLSGVDWSKPVPRKYDIGMNEYVGDTAFQQSESANSIKKGKENALSLSLEVADVICPATEASSNYFAANIWK